ncbi:MAG: DNA cytosine methyltransferase [Kiritimatiellae bacterium]|nr:DNA cytosine methyltransferase [Kiritimatiellia bacterium]
MTTKKVQKERKDAIPRVVSGGTRIGVSPAGRVVLVGTYKGSQLTKWRGWYNYPISDADKIGADDAAGITELWLFKGTREQKNYRASFVGVKTRDELIRDYGYPAGGRAHGDKYLLFKTEYIYPSEADPPEDAGSVIIRTADFAKRSPRIAKQLKAYLESPDRRDPDLAKRLPSIITRLRPERLRVCEAAVQLDFISVLDDVAERTKCFRERGIDTRAIRFIDLFAGIGGIRKGFEQACEAAGYKPLCVFTSEIKPHAIEVLRQNHPEDYIHGDITTIDAKDIPDFDILLGGFPCQAFSAAGKRHGFEDTRGTLFFDVARIIKEKQPFGFVLENVEGLVNHDRRDKNAPFGNTLKVILDTLSELGYLANWRVMNAKDFGVPQERKRIYIIGTKKARPNLESFEIRHTTVGDILEKGLETGTSNFIDKLLSHYSIDELLGKSIKDKRGGKNNIHSWDIELKGPVSEQQKLLLNRMLKERRKHQWAEIYGIDWMDGMPLTLDMIRSFYDVPNLEEMLEDLALKKYVVKEHPKKRVKVGNVFERVEDLSLPMGYNIVAGKMSFEVSKILSPAEQAPTLVAMDMQHLYVADGKGIRKLSLREGLNLFGYPADFKFDVPQDLGYDLLGNTVVVPVIRQVASRVLDIYKENRK